MSRNYSFSLWPCDPYRHNSFNNGKKHYVLFCGADTIYVDLVMTFGHKIVISNKSSVLSKENIQWGVFEVFGDRKIRFEKWYPHHPLEVFIREGDILNDTTFVIREVYKNKNGRKKDVQSKNELYRFKQFSPKPDSTNSFIK